MKEGRYEYLDKLGEGGMATVYRGIQKSLDRQVAIKVLSAKLSNNPSVIKRFKRESLIIARLNHPNIIHVIDKGTTSKGRPVFVMEYVEGKTLSDLVADGEVSFHRKVDIMVQICKGIAYAHKLDVIHRDIKPANVLIDDEGNARILDFGIASFFTTDKDAQADETKLVMGTEAYMAPEQQKGIIQTTTLSDVYSLGVVMHELFLGALPTANSIEMSRSRSDYPGSLLDLIEDCLHHTAADRPASVEEVKNKLLLAMKGKHIGQEEKQRAGEGLTAIEEKFSLLDIMREDKFSSVYLYEDKSSHNLLVIKKRSGSLAGLREAGMLKKLKHRNVVPILGTSKNNNIFITVMEYIPGGSLQDRLIQPFPFKAFVPVAIQICEGIAHAHANRIFHGNLRPSNILLTSDMKVKLTDFGLDEHYRTRGETDSWYSAKETPADELTDIYSLGAIFFHALSGQPPEFKENKPVRNSSFAALPPDIQHIITRMLSPEREKRPQSVEAIISEFQPFVVVDKTEVRHEASAAEVAPAQAPRQVVVKSKSSPLGRFVIWSCLIISLSLNILLVSDMGPEIRGSIQKAIISVGLR